MKSHRHALLAFAAFAWLSSSCTMAPPGYKRIELATNNGAKFWDMTSGHPDGGSWQWEGAVDAKGFATGRGTRTTVSKDGQKFMEQDANFATGIRTEGATETRFYKNGVVTSRHSGWRDKEGKQHGRQSVVNFDADTDGSIISSYDNYSHGVKSGEYEICFKGGRRIVGFFVNGVLSGKKTIYEPNGTQNVIVYSNGEETDFYKVAADGTVTRDYRWDRVKQMRENAQAFRAQTAREEAARREARSSAFFGGLAQGLAGIAASSNSYSGSSYPRSSSSASSYSNSSRSPQLTLTPSSRESAPPIPSKEKKFVTLKSGVRSGREWNGEGAAYEEVKELCRGDIARQSSAWTKGKLFETKTYWIQKPNVIPSGKWKNVAGSEHPKYKAVGGQMATDYYYFE